MDFAVPTRIKNLSCWTTASEDCWSVCLWTFTTVVKRTLAEFFSFFDVLQCFRLFTTNLKSIQDKIFHFFSWFQLLSKTISAKTTYGNPLLFGLYNNSQRWEMVKFVKEKGEISQFSSLSRYSCNLSCPGTTMFMLVPGTIRVCRSCW